MNKQSQQKAILNLLKSKKVVTLPEIMKLKTGFWPFRQRIASHTRRISDLRLTLKKQGMNVKNFKEWDKQSKSWHSFYMLVNI